MALLSSHLLLRLHSLTLFLTAYLLLTNPTPLLSASSIWLIGESMSLPPASFAATPSFTSYSSTVQATREVLALLGLVLSIAGLAQMVFAGDLALPGSEEVVGVSRSQEKREMEERGLGERVYMLNCVQTRWLDVLGLRVLGMGGLVGWVYLVYSGKEVGKAQMISSGLGLLANRVVFTCAMLDMLVCGYLWTLIREERREVLVMLAKRKQVEEDMGN